MWLIPRERVFVFGRAFRHDPLQATSRAGEHPRHCIVIRRRQRQEPRRRSGAPVVGVDAVEREGVKVEVEV
jgi:hypothetical protein